MAAPRHRVACHYPALDSGGKKLPKALPEQDTWRAIRSVIRCTLIRDGEVSGCSRYKKGHAPRNPLQSLWHSLGAQGHASAAFAALVVAYAEPQRFYHNAAHIGDCLRQFDLARAQAVKPEEVEAALWFHDVVYDPRARDNEEQSAAWARQTLGDARVASDMVERIAALILLTRHDREPDGPDGKLVLDVDLSILGREPAVFAEYDRCIREEYRWVPEDQYRQGRATILEGFLQRPAIYRTSFFDQRLEKQARENLAHAVVRLRRLGEG
jgi:predicted metal-dependent HD superfamily phosphohydrolase